MSAFACCFALRHRILMHKAACTECFGKQSHTCRTSGHPPLPKSKDEPAGTYGPAGICGSCNEAPSCKTSEHPQTSLGCRRGSWDGSGRSRRPRIWIHTGTTSDHPQTNDSTAVGVFLKGVLLKVDYFWVIFRQKSKSWRFPEVVRDVFVMLT